MSKQEYELSLWDIKNTEKKIAILASDSLNDYSSAYNINYTIKQNGEKTLTFSLHYKYIDKDGIEKINPYAEYMVNSARLKLRDGPAYYATGSTLTAKATSMKEEDTNELWSDFEITEVTKNSQNLELLITAKELYANELGRNGWSITLDTELENNYGTASELATAVLAGSNWTVASDSYNPTERISEPLFITKVNEDINVRRVLYDTDEEETDIIIKANNYIYIFYSCLKLNDDKEWVLDSDEIQFLWAGESKHFTRDSLDDELRIVDDDMVYNYQIAKSDLTAIDDIIVTGSSDDPFSIHLTGYRIAKQQYTHLCTQLDDYVYDWDIIDKTKAGAPSTVDKAMSYIETSYGNVAQVSNLINNSTDFTSWDGWEGYYTNAAEEAVEIDLDAKVFPAVVYDKNEDIVAETAQKRVNYLELDFEKPTTYYINKGPYVNALELTKDDIYVIRTRFRWMTDGSNYKDTTIKTDSLVNLIFSLYDYKNHLTVATTTIQCSDVYQQTKTRPDDDTGYPIPVGEDARDRTKYNDNLNTTYHDELGYYYVYFKANNSTNKTTNPLYLEIEAETAETEYKLYVEDLQLFKYVEAGISISLVNEIVCETVVFPEDPVTSVINNVEKFFYLDDDDEIQYLSSDTSCYSACYPERYASVRSLSVSKSNYFNNIQEIAELFQIWVQFKVSHDKNGNLYYGDNGLPIKQVKFSRYSPNGTVINYAGFKRGLNESSISRVMNSDQIATKVIVSDNSQEYATDGACSITRARSNISGENTIYNFSYFIEKGLIDEETLNADIYGLGEEDIGLYSKMRLLNNKYDTLSTQLQDINSMYDEVDAKLQILESKVQSLEKQMSTQREQLDKIIEEIEEPTEMDYYNNLVLTYNENVASYQQAKPEYDEIKELYDYYKEQMNYLSAQMKIVTSQKQSITDQFYTKYYQFIREGTWSDDEYMDDELYYLDGMKIAETSAYPKVTYTINVSDIINVYEDYSEFDFKVGERSYIEDGEFFGYTSLDYNGKTYVTPNKIEVIISECKKVLDNPSTSTITVKNYKNQFEELFQKITAQTQQLSYQAGSYERAANAVLSDGSLNGAALTGGLSNSLSLGANDSFVWNTNTGIVMTNTLNTNEKIKLIGSGLYCSNDGGETWSTGISGSGVNAETITTGNLDVDKVTIYSGGQPLFNWNKDGLHVYAQLPPKETGGDIRNGYINYNQYGLYGTDDPESFEEELNAVSGFENKLNVIKNFGTFSLTWDGLNINDAYGESGLQMELAPGIFEIRKDKTKLFGIDADNGSVVFGSSSTQGSGLSITEARLGGDDDEIGKWIISKHGLGTEVSSEEQSAYPGMYLYDANNTIQVECSESETETYVPENPVVLHIQDSFNVEDNGKAHLYNARLNACEIDSLYPLVNSTATGTGTSIGSTDRGFDDIFFRTKQTPSTRKIKKNIEPIPDYNIDAMEPVRFNYVNDLDENKTLGFIAEDMYKICPEIIGLDNKGEPATINYEGLIPILVKEIQDLRKRVAELESKI